jgi:3-phenylpropionate/trans-cinnamate dioxygenase ferredoxin reductase component
MLLGKRVESVDPAAYSLTMADGEIISYGKMICAKGGSPRWL